MLVAAVNNGGEAPELVPLQRDHFRPTTRPTFQIRASVGLGIEAQEAFSRAVALASGWVEGRWNNFTGTSPRLSETDQTEFTIDEPGGYRLQVIKLPDQGIWSARLDHPDLPFGDREAVAGRTWFTEIAIRRVDSEVHFGLRNSCTSHVFSAARIFLTRPRLILDIASQLGLSDGWQFDGEVNYPYSEDDFVRLKSYLASPSRTVPVIAVSENAFGESSVDAKWIARRTQGFAIVVAFSDDEARGWTALVGQPWGVYRGAVRTYNPGLDFENQSPTAHPRALPETIATWTNGGDIGPRAFAKHLVYSAARSAAYRRIEWQPVAFTAEARREANQLAMAAIRQTGNETEQYRRERDLVKAELEDAKRELAEQTAEFNRWLDDYALQENRLQALEQEHDKLKTLIHALRSQLEQKSSVDLDSQIPAPESYGDLDEWADTHLAGRLKLAPRALKGLKEAIYEDFGIVWRALLLLAKEYRDMRLGAREDAKDLWERRLGESGLGCEGAASMTSAGKFADEYIIVDPFGTNVRRQFEFHLSKGNSREPRYCLRIYFYWDEKEQQVVVGWLPSHLTTTTT